MLSLCIVQHSHLAVCQSQIKQQASQVAVDFTDILEQAKKTEHDSHNMTAGIWTDGSLADTEDGLPRRKTRIYISDSMTLRIGPVTKLGHDQPGTKDGDLTQPAKKKRKGKAERNRIKREAEALADKHHPALPVTA